MAFVSKANNGGEIDPRINQNGRPSREEKKLTNRELREREFMSLLRKLKPLVAQSIATAVKIMGNEEASHQNQLKAATIILAEFKSSLEHVYDAAYDADEGIEAQPTGPKAPIFSLTMVRDGKELEKE